MLLPSRRHSHQGQVPHSHVGPAERRDASSIPPDDAADGEEPAKTYTCDRHIGDEGTKCGRQFSSTRALLMHQRFSKLPNHSYRTWLPKLCPANQCIMCNTCFSDKKNTLDHMKRSWRQGRCISDNTALPHPLRHPQATTMRCTRVCGGRLERT